MGDHADSAVVRTAGVDDLLAVLRVYSQRDPGGDPARVASPVEQSTWTRMMDTDNLTVYLADIAGRPVGTATLLTMPTLNYDCAPTAFVEAMVVVHDERRRGIASTIVRRILDDARSAGCNKVQLLSHKRHATDGAHRLYTALGFEAEAEGFRRYLGPVPAAVQAARIT